MLVNCMRSAAYSKLTFADFFRDNSLKTLILTTGVLTMHTLLLYQNCLLTQLVKEVPDTPRVESMDQLAELLERKEAVLNLISPQYVMAMTLMQTNEYDEVLETRYFTL